PADVMIRRLVQWQDLRDRKRSQPAAYRALVARLFAGELGQRALADLDQTQRAFDDGATVVDFQMMLGPGYARLNDLNDGYDRTSQTRKGTARHVSAQYRRLAWIREMVQDGVTLAKSQRSGPSERWTPDPAVR